MRAWFRSYSRSVRSRLIWLVIGCILPIAIWDGALLLLSYERERANRETGSIETARALMQAVDGELNGAVGVLRVLATSPLLVSGDLAGFHHRLVQISATSSGSNISLVSPDGQVLLNALTPFGAPLPMFGNPAAVRRALDTGRPVITDVFVGSNSGEPRVSVVLPVIADGHPVYVLAMVYFPQRLSEILLRQRIPSHWIAVILDHRGIIAARSVAAQRFVGMRAPTALIEHIAAAPEGAADGQRLDGVPTRATFSRSDVSGWSIVIGIPAAEFVADLRRSLALDSAATLIALALGAAFARSLGRRITQPINALIESAGAQGGGEIARPDTGVAEVDALGSFLQGARDLIAQRVQERDAARDSEQRMAIAAEAAAEADRAKTEFLSHMSHEFRTPMNGILGFGQLLAGGRFGPLTEKQHQFVGNILNSGRHLLALVNDILDLSKIEAGRMDVSIEPIALPPLMHSIVLTLEASAEAAGITLRPGNFGHDMPVVLADRTRLAQALLNLGSNAIKYNRVHGSVAFAYHCTPEATVRIEVHDTGVGIPPDRQAELFQPFSRLGTQQNAIEGTGIGLALTRRIVTLMGGAIGFSSVAGEGSCFWIDLPSYGTATGSHDTAETAALSTQTRRPFSILYIEADPLNLALMREVVATLDDVELVDAVDARTGLALAEEHRPDLIVLDINLPGHDGPGVLNRLKRLTETANIPVLALSAGATPAEAERGLQAGFFHYRAKPRDLNEFIEAVLDVMASIRAATQAPAGAAEPASVRRSQAAAPGSTHPLQVLVVDDSAMNREIAAAFLHQAGHDVSFATSGIEAVAAAAANDFDVILMDVRMPGMDGLEATRRIRMLLGPRGQVPVVALTAQAFADQIEACRTAGMQGHVAKPFDEKVLLDAVTQAAATRIADEPGDDDDAWETGRSCEPDCFEEPEATPSPAATGTEPVLFDRAAFDAIARMLPPEQVAAYLRTLVDNVETLLIQLREPGLPGGDADELAQSSHALAGTAGMLGFLRLSGAARHFERAVHGGAIGAKGHAAALMRAGQQMLEFIRTDRLVEPAESELVTGG
jgi:signal transduction histidine kinase/CheY-like chemotaxis protein/HPt (histidine-containing phosphotransfer) domain-containing protein